MRRILAILLCFTIEALTIGNVVNARSYRTESTDVFVNGYFKKDGTYVSPYFRSAPDWIIENNYSCIDNWRCDKSDSINTQNGNVNHSSNSNLIHLTSTCQTLYWSLSVHDISNRAVWQNFCTCDTGAVWNNERSKCVPLEPQDLACKESFWKYAYIDLYWKCLCSKGYGFNHGMSECIDITIKNRAKKEFSFLKNSFSKLQNYEKISKYEEFLRKTKTSLTKNVRQSLIMNELEKHILQELRNLKK